MRGIRIYLAALFIFFSGNHALMAKGGDFGAGFILGDPSGVTGKYFSLEMMLLILVLVQVPMMDFIFMEII